MKYINILAVITIFIAAGCSKPADKFFNGNARIGGIIYFENVVTGKEDTAKNAAITLSLASDTNIRYKKQLTNGNYSIPDLKGGVYILKIVYQFNNAALSEGLIYNWTSKKITISDNANKADSSIMMPLDSSHYKGTALRLLVTDPQGAALPSAQVCLYTSASTLLANRNTCNGSLVSSTTNTEGFLIFDNLEAKGYYASSYKLVGKDSLSNQSTDQTALKTLAPGTISRQPLSLTVQPPVLPTALKVTVMDAFGANLSNVTVCLYSNPDFIMKYAACEGSLQTLTSDASGSVTFTGLQSLNYYVEAYKLIGTESISNNTTKLMPTGVLKKNTTTPFPVTVK